ncbi:unnamed protein product [Boreogadus saida]
MFSSVPSPATPARAMSPEQQQRADSPGPSCVSMERSKKKKKKDGNHQPSKERHQERPMVTSAQSVQHQTELEMNQEELADTLWGGELRRIRTEFVKRVSDEVIKGLLDELYQHDVFSSEEKDSVMEEQKSRADQARCLIDMVIRKGEGASQMMIDIFKERDKLLCSTLGLISSLAGVEQVRNQSAGLITLGSSGRGSLPESELSGPVDGKSSVPLDGHGSTLGEFKSPSSNNCRSNYSTCITLYVMVCSQDEYVVHLFNILKHVLFGKGMWLPRISVGGSGIQIIIYYKAHH